MTPDPEPLSPKQYAQRHGVTTRTVHRWIKAGRLNVLRISKRTIRIVSVRRLRQEMADSIRTVSDS